MLLANFDRKEHLQHRAVSLRQHGFLVCFSFVCWIKLITLSFWVHVRPKLFYNIVSYRRNSVVHIVFHTLQRTLCATPDKQQKYASKKSRYVWVWSISGSMGWDSLGFHRLFFMYGMGMKIEIQSSLQPCRWMSRNRLKLWLYNFSPYSSPSL